jgi:hypothetical protein
MFARLESPEMLAIQRTGSTMTMASSRAQQATFEADGVERQAQLNGRSSKVTPILIGNQLGVTIRFLTLEGHESRQQNRSKFGSQIHKRGPQRPHREKLFIVQ